MKNKTNMLFEENHYGKPISEKLSEIIRRNIKPDSIKEVAKNSSVSIGTIKGVIYSGNNVTELNSTAIIELARVAFRNCMNTRKQAEADAEFFAREIEVK